LLHGVMMITVLVLVAAAAAAIAMQKWGIGEPGLGRLVLSCTSVSIACVTVGLFLLNDRYWLAGLRWQLSALEHSRDALRQTRRDRLDGLLRVGRMMGSHAESPEVLAIIADTCLEHFDCDQASVMLLNQANNELEVRYAAGHDNPNEVIGARVRIGRGIAGWVAERNRPLVLGNNLDIRRADDAEQLRSPSAAMIVPICVQNRVVGVLNVATRTRSAAYDESDLCALLVFAEIAGVCIRQAEQAKWLQTRIATLENQRAAEVPTVQQRDKEPGPAH